MNALILNALDNVAIALEDLTDGVTAAGVAVRAAIPRGHKFALRAIAAGEPVLKYGLPIGTARSDIASGAHVHVHNMRFEAGLERPVGAAQQSDLERHSALRARTFRGFLRENGSVGTRNYIGVLTTVNCSATVAKQIARRCEDVTAFPNVDGVIALTHTSGCGMAHQGEGIELLQRTIGGYARQPNFAAVLLIGLGCEVNQTDRLMRDQALVPGSRLRTLSIQDVGGTPAAIERGIAIVRELLELANSDQRVEAPIAALKLALQCGGSDGWSGMTANPALGAAADRLVAAGGSVVLSETPEIYGAESLLLARATSPAVQRKLLDRLRWWEDYAAKHGTDLNNNPSPGNIAGGLSTILEKSLGAVAKGGTAPLQNVLLYGEEIGPGFQFMDTPGYDPCSATGQIAGGANLMAFTTGRGAVFGAKPVPSIKLSSNSALAVRQSEDIDIDCGDIAGGLRSVDELGSEIFERLLRVASGEKSASERLGFGEAEFVPWVIGAVM